MSRSDGDGACRVGALHAAFVDALPGLALSACATSPRAVLLNESFARFVAGGPPLEELATGCTQYLEYARREEAGPAGLEAACGDFLAYLRELRELQHRGEAEPVAPSASGPAGPPVRIVQREVQWYSASEADETVARLRAEAVASLDLKGASVDAQDSDTIGSDAASALAAGLSHCAGTLEALSLTDMKLSVAGLGAVLNALAGSLALRRLDLSNMCSRWTVTNTLGSERGALLSQLIVGWRRLESLILADCTLAAGCVPVAHALGGCAQLREVDLTYNEMDDAAATVLARSLEGKLMLELVALDGNDISPTGLAAIKGTLSSAGKLAVLH
jgi:hypothetical protein